MLESATIKNFRVFRDIKIDGLKTLNIVLGRNASGKTALFEALFLALGSSPELSQRLRLWRSITNFVPQNAAMDQRLWSDLFPNFDLSKTIEISIKGKGDHSRNLIIRYDDKGISNPVQVDPNQPPVMASSIRFEYSKPGKTAQIARAAPVAGQMAYFGADSLSTETVFFASQLTHNSVEVCDRFSEVVRRDGKKKLLDAVRSEFEFITDLNVLTNFGTPMLYAGLHDSDHTVPIGLVSSGVSKIIAILVAIAAFRGGVIFLDEVENGIYYDRYESLWRVLYSFAKDNGVQIFASTHSRECLQALANVADDWRKDVCFIRAIGEGQLEQFHGSTMFGAMEIGEIR